MGDSTVEPNGPANILQDLDSFQNGWITQAVFFSRIEENAKDTIRYMQELSNPKNVRWSDIKGRSMGESGSNGWGNRV